MIKPIFWRVFWRDLHLAFRNNAEIFNPLWFFVIVITLFPLGIGPEPRVLTQIAPGIVWVAALLAALLGMDRLFRDDYLDGSLEQMMLMSTPLSIIVMAKIAAHWVVTGLPLLLLSPLVALLFGLSWQSWQTLALTLLLGTPTLSFIGAIGTGLTVGLGRSGVLLSLLVLPLTIPLLIFATAAVDATQMQLPIAGYLAILGAFLVGSATLSPFATAAALRISIQ
ncbi:heme exporter protein CcmB [Enterobacteriaceae bacterium ESL0689]|nr:heme exporter protein CcmB [Enterobacteriaceae bacterium ESL0689]